MCKVLSWKEYVTEVTLLPPLLEIQGSDCTYLTVGISFPSVVFPLPPTVTLYLLNPSPCLTGVVFPLGSVQFGSMSRDSQKMFINPFSCFNIIDSNALSAVKVASGHKCGAGKNIVSFLQIQPPARKAQAPRMNLEAKVRG